MRLKFSSYQKFILFILLINFQLAMGQNIADGVPYQTIVRDNTGIPLTNQSVSIKLALYSGSPTGLLQWEEIFNKYSDQNGLVKLTIGAGITTGNGSSASFSSINWSASTYYLKIAIDISGGTSYTNIGSAQLLSVPYSFYSLSTDVLTDYYLDQLLDVAIPSPITGKLLKWNGSLWIAANDNDSDTVLFAYNSFHSQRSDTSFYSYSSLVGDSVLFAYRSDTSQFANFSLNSIITTDAVHSDTALYALSGAPIAWKTDGNTIGTKTSYIGTNDVKDILLKTNNTEAFRINSIGNIFIGSASDTCNFSLKGDDGMLFKGTFAIGSLSTSGAGTKLLWHPAKASFRAGGITSNQWDDANIGNYSFAAGYNCMVIGIYSFASGNSCLASGGYGVAMGNKCQALVNESYALGDSSVSSSGRGVAIGRGNIASTNNAAIAIGNYNLSTGAISASYGTHSTASGHYSFVMGYYGSSNNRTGSFVYADASSSTITNSTINNQFLIKASGGIIFYSDPLNTMGVILPAGGGSWASVSDKNKKENFKLTNDDEILNKIENLKITSWTYISQNRSIRHIGPMAQDFYKTFHLGDNNKTISVIDMDGVTLLGIKLLQQRIKLLSPLNKTEELSTKMEQLDNFAELNDRLDEIEKKLNKK
jgi:hypothetical protein